MTNRTPTAALNAETLATLDAVERRFKRSVATVFVNLAAWDDCWLANGTRYYGPVNEFAGKFWVKVEGRRIAVRSCPLGWEEVPAEVAFFAPARSTQPRLF